MFKKGAMQSYKKSFSLSYQVSLLCKSVIISLTQPDIEKANSMYQQTVSSIEILFMIT